MLGFALTALRFAFAVHWMTKSGLALALSCLAGICPCYAHTCGALLLLSIKLKYLA